MSTPITRAITGTTTQARHELDAAIDGYDAAADDYAAMHEAMREPLATEQPTEGRELELAPRCLHLVAEGASRTRCFLVRRHVHATEDEGLFLGVAAGKEPGWAGPPEVCSTCRRMLADVEARGLAALANGREHGTAFCDGSGLLGPVKPVDGVERAIAGEPTSAFNLRVFCRCCSASWPSTTSGPVPDHTAEVRA